MFSSDISKIKHCFAKEVPLSITRPEHGRGSGVYKVILDGHSYFFKFMTEKTARERDIYLAGGLASEYIPKLCNATYGIDDKFALLLEDVSSFCWHPTEAETYQKSDQLLNAISEIGLAVREYWDVGDIVVRFRDRLSNDVSALGASCQSSDEELQHLRKRVETKVLSHYETFVARDKPSFIHGNLSRFNILINSESVKIIDFENYKIGSQYEDYVHLSFFFPPLQRSKLYLCKRYQIVALLCLDKIVRFFLERDRTPDIERKSNFFVTEYKKIARFALVDE